MGSQQTLHTASQRDILRALAREFRMPLTHIAHASDILQSEKLSKQEQNEQLRRIELRSQAMLEILDGLLLLGRIDAGETAPSLHPLSLASVAHDVIEQHQAMSQRLGRHIILSTTKQLAPATANYDCVYYALSNAIDGVLRSSHSEVIEVLVHNQNQEVMVTIRDDGQSFSNSDIERLLNSLGQTKQPIASMPGSSGISLYISKLLADATSGRLFAQKVRGKRTTSLAFQRSEQLTLLA